MNTKFMFKLFYFIIPIFFTFISCAESNASKTYCDEEKFCLEGFQCLENNCERIPTPCSEKFKNGDCTNKSEECIEGVCQTKVNSKCKDVTCSNKGACSVIDNIAVCICREGYQPQGLNCIETGSLLCGETQCSQTQHCENNNCLENKKNVTCDINIELPNENAEVLETEVEITWNNTWETIPKCDWTCKQGYEKKDNQCIKSTSLCSPSSPSGLCNNQNQLCIQGQCIFPEMGSICDKTSHCPDDLICFTSSSLSKGYCTKKCDNSTCGDGFECGKLVNDNYCLKQCQSTSYCRDDFTCYPDKLCKPKCLSDANCESYESCKENIGQCQIENPNCSLYESSCDDNTKACYPFEDISQTACAKKGILEESKLCSSDNICLEGTICTNINPAQPTQKRCTKPCRPSKDISESNIYLGNSDCLSYNKCVKKENWDDLGYCKYDSSLVPVGVSCDSSTDCGHNEALCGQFDGTVDIKICTSSCFQEGAMDLNRETYVNEVICAKFTGGLFWMDICEQDSDCYDENFECYFKDTYMRKYCMPKSR